MVIDTSAVVAALLNEIDGARYGDAMKEADARGIYGEATREEVASLVEDGVDFMPLPTVPEEHN